MEETEVLEHLKALHEKTLLTEPEVSLRDVNRLYRDAISDEIHTLIANELPDIEESVVTEAPTNNKNFAKVHPDNILPEGTKRHVRFNLPLTKKLHGSC